MRSAPAPGRCSPPRARSRRAAAPCSTPSRSRRTSPSRARPAADRASGRSAPRAHGRPLAPRRRSPGRDRGGGGRAPSHATLRQGHLGVAEGLHPRADCPTSTVGAAALFGRVGRRSSTRSARSRRPGPRAARAPRVAELALQRHAGLDARRDPRARAQPARPAGVMVAASEQSVGADRRRRSPPWRPRNGLERRRALEIGVKAVVQACPVFLGDLRTVARPPAAALRREPAARRQV